MNPHFLLHPNQNYFFNPTNDFFFGILEKIIEETAANGPFSLNEKSYCYDLEVLPIVCKYGKDLSSFYEIITKASTGHFVSKGLTNLSETEKAIRWCGFGNRNDFNDGLYLNSFNSSAISFTESCLRYYKLNLLNRRALTWYGYWKKENFEAGEINYNESIEGRKIRVDGSFNEFELITDLSPPNFVEACVEYYLLNR